MLFETDKNHYDFLVVRLVQYVNTYDELYLWLHHPGLPLEFIRAWVKMIRVGPSPHAPSSVKMHLVSPPSSQGRDNKVKFQIVGPEFFADQLGLKF